MKKSDIFEVWTDGSCSPNPGPGGWGYTRSDGKEEFGGELQTSNNKMELTAILKALQSLPMSVNAVIHSDSQYGIKGMNIWRHGWKRKAWKRGDGELKNVNIWMALDAEANKRPHVIFNWVKGHNGTPGNERADWLANKGRESVFTPEAA